MKETSLPRTRRRRNLPPFLRPLPWALLGLGALHLWAAGRLPASFVDGFYHRTLYPPILALLGGTCAGFSWSLSGFLFLSGGIFFLFRFLGLLASAFQPGFALRCVTALFRFLLVLSLLVHPFFLFWGWHYRATPLEKRLRLEGPLSPSAEEAFLARALAETARLREPALSLASGPIPSRTKEVKRALKALGLGDLPLPDRVKAPPIPGMLLLSGTLGITSPFTLEAHVEPALHWADRPFLEAHELAHLGGISGEGEANFAAWYALATSRHPFHRYCAWLAVLLQFPPRLALEKAAPAVAADLRAAREARARGRVEWISRFSWSLYDRYLKGRGIRRGIADYGRLTALAARYAALHPGEIPRSR